MQRFPAVRRFNDAVAAVWERAANMVEAGANPPPNVADAIGKLGGVVAQLRDAENEVRGIIRRAFEDARRRGAIGSGAEIPQGLGLLPVAIVAALAAAIIAIGAAVAWRLYRLDATFFPQQQAQARAHAAVIEAWRASIRPGDPVPPLPALPTVENPGSGVVAGSLGTLAALAAVAWFFLRSRRR